MPETTNKEWTISANNVNGTVRAWITSRLAPGEPEEVPTFENSLHQ